MMPGRSNRMSDGQALSENGRSADADGGAGGYLLSLEINNCILYIRFVRTPCKSACATAYSPRKLLEFRVV